jgi:K(+)-stimulated pyrophosphate-energized sodium pump
MVFIGFLLGGAVPFLFSSMLIRAVGRAAFLIVKECRDAVPRQGNLGRHQEARLRPRRRHLHRDRPEGTHRPRPSSRSSRRSLVGFLLGTQALGGFLAGMILVGQLLAVFMANAGGAWDNAKKMIEDGNYGGKGSEAHKAAVTGDTVGDPLKDTAGPAINPLIKVMNMVSLRGHEIQRNQRHLRPGGRPARRARMCRDHRLGDLAEQARVEGIAGNGKTVPELS